MSPLSGVIDPADVACWESLAALIPPGSVSRVPVWEVPDVGPNLVVERVDGRVQMVHSQPMPRAAHASAWYARLSSRDAADMIELARLARPGPMERRTVELGTYLGVRNAAGRLVAMAGERLRLPGWTEISAVCTHPDHRGHGLATQLVRVLIRAIEARGETAFLNVVDTNTAAQRLYGSLGFTVRRQGYAIEVANRNAPA